MLAKISSEQLTEWIADYELAPWGEDRLEVYFAQLSALVVNVHRSKRFERPGDFLIEFSPDKSPEAQLAKLEEQLIALTLRMGGEVK